MTGNELGTTHIMEDDLDQALEAIARVPILLVATDYDGTLSPIVDNPEEDGFQTMSLKNFWFFKVD